MQTTLKTTVKAAYLALTLIAGTAATGVAAEAHSHAHTHASNAENRSQMSSEKDIVDTAVAAGQFETLVAAVKAAKLVDVLKSDGPFTVFAPNDPAFAKLGDKTINSLLKPEAKSRLTDVLTYHVVPGKITAKDLASRKFVTTVNGQRLYVGSRNGLRINDSGFVATDLKTSNGIIHVVDAVLIPSDKNLAETAKAAGKFNTLIAAAKTAGLVDALTAADANVTVLAPTDDAFAKLGKDAIADLLRPENRETLQTILKYHVLPGRVYSSDLLIASDLSTLAGEPLSLTVKDGKFRVNASNIAAADIQASNGVVHVIDSVLIPPSVANAPRSSSNDRRMTPAAELIALAIDEGAPLYNNGQKQACAAIYLVAAKGVLADADSGLSRSDRRTLRDAVRSSERTHDMSERAWTLRRAFDRVLMNEAQMAARGH